MGKLIQNYNLGIVLIWIASDKANFERESGLNNMLSEKQYCTVATISDIPVNVVDTSSIDIICAPVMHI